MEDILLGTTDRTIAVFIPDPASTDGSGKTGLVAANLTLSYTRIETDNDVVVTDATGSLNDLSALTDAHNDWGLKEVSSTLAPGLYRLDVADAVFASGAWYAVVYVMITTSAAAATPKAFRLVAFNALDGVRLGLTALPNAAAEAAGGLYTRGTGAGQINQQTNGQIDANVERLVNVAQSAADLKDFADDGYDPSTNKVQGVVLADTVTTYTGNTPQTGDSFARLGAPAGASVSADIAAIEAQTDDIGVAGAGLTALGDIRIANLDAAITTRLAPTTAGRTLDVTAAGNAGIDWANVENPTTALNLSATNIDVDQVVASVSGAVGSVTGAVGSVTGNVGGNVVGSVGSVTAGVTLAASAVQAIWDALTSALTTVGSIGKKLADWTIGTAQTGDSFARLGAPVGASISADIAAVQADTDNIQTRLPAALVSGRMDASVGAMATDTVTAAALAADAVTEIQSGLSTLNAAGIRTAVGLASANLDTQLTAIDDFLDTEVAAIKAQTDLIPASPAAVGSAMTLTSGERDSVADALLDRTAGVETNRTPRQALRLMLSALAGKLSGAATTTVAIRDTNDSKDRITATVDADGNRTAVTLDAS